MNPDLLFVYGTLRSGHDGPMARWLAETADHRGTAWARGCLYLVADYPGFVPGGGGQVRGDIFALSDPAAMLAILDEHEECSERFPQPHEYRRARLTVERADGPIEAWVYVYARDTAGLIAVEGGDFLCGRGDDR
ncbi:MAG: gamma-glutamylcyclotransferase family protein [Sphingobium sp.]